VDPRSDYFVSERIGLQLALRPLARLHVLAGADYDMAAGWWGSAEATVAYTDRSVRATLGARRYRPHFELWTVWGAFSPVPYRAAEASLAVSATARLELRARYERYEFESSDAATPLLDEERDGWRWDIGGTVWPLAGWTLDGGYQIEFGPGAAARGAAGSATYAPSRRVSVSALVSTVSRPLEFRFNDAVVRSYGVDAAVEPTPRVRVGLTAVRYEEIHRRGDAGAFDWSQLRVAARVVLQFGQGADRSAVPPAIRLLPGGRSAR
jgi:hypothetical protein